jgi:ATP-binding cassette subfamily F protein uup
VASWAARFLFTGEQLNQPVERLSGGERARVLIAQLMLQPADLLLLDEPTNDLDIPTLEILEQSLLEFPGSLVLVTHDRYMLDRVSNIVVGLDGQGSAESFADYSQWESWQGGRTPAVKAKAHLGNQAAVSVALPLLAKTKLSYLEAREYAVVEQRLAEAQEVFETKRAQLEEPAIASDSPRLVTAHREMEEAAQKVDALYARWAELEEKKGGV